MARFLSSLEVGGMARSLRYAGAVGLMVLGTAPLTPQRTGQQSGGPVILVTVDLVQLDAAATDSRGNHVTDLKPEDFQILEDRKPQAITHFSYVPGTPIPGGPGPVNPAPRAPPGKPPEAIPTPAKALRLEQVQCTIVLMADDLGLSSDDIPSVRKAMKSFVDRQMQAGDLASIMTTSGGTGAMQQLTNDKRQLLASIDRIHYVPGRSGLTWYDPVHRFGNVAEPMNARLNAIRRPFLAIGTIGALSFAIQGLREMPGRKAIAFFSDGFMQSAGGLVELANRASVVLYTFDPRGLASFSLTAVDVCTDCLKPGVIEEEEAKRQTAYRDSQTSLDQLARGTGGIFFHDNNDLDQGLATALDDMAGYYLIGYQPQRDDFDQARGRPQFHKTEVKVLRPGLQVRSRNGFVGVPDPPALSEDAARKSGKEELRKALLSPFHSNGFPVQLSAVYSAATVKDPKIGRRPTLLRAMLAIDARGLRFNDTPEGRKQLDLDIVAAAYGANNEVVTSSHRTFSVAITPDEMNQIVASGLVYGFEFAILQPGPYQLRVAVWDANSERAGSAASVRTQQSLAWSTPCCCGACRSRTPAVWWPCGRTPATWTFRKTRLLLRISPIGRSRTASSLTWPLLRRGRLP